MNEVFIYLFIFDVPKIHLLILINFFRVISQSNSVKRKVSHQSTKMPLKHLGKDCLNSLPNIYIKKKKKKKQQIK